ncbi:MAG: integrase core domain-containing protein, partial [Pseudomonadota bacterium]
RGRTTRSSGQVERMNRTLKEATVRRYHHDNHDALREHLRTFLEAYNSAKRLKTLKGKTPFEFIVEKWASETRRFSTNPSHLIPGLNF